jgi:hypothetical protein
MALSTFDQNYYLTHNPDVLQAVLNGVFASAEEHYVLFGESEGRMPSAYFDPTGYFASNPDVLSAVQAGVFATGLQHFEEFGVFEGRTPGATGGDIQFDETYYLQQNPDVAAAVAAGTFSSGYEHFVKFGSSEGRAPAEGVLPGTPGQDFALTQEIGELVEGTSGDDTFVGLMDVGNPETFNITDQVDGLGGTDTFNLFVANTLNTPAPPGAQVRSMEIVNLISTSGGTFANDALGVDPSFFGGVTQLWQVGLANNLVNVNGVTAGFRDGAAAFTNTVQFDATSGAIAVDSITSGSSFTVAGESATNQINELSVSGTVDSAGGGAPGVLDLTNGGFEVIETLNVDISSAVNLVGTAGNATLVDFVASQSQGDINVNLFNYFANLESAVFGTGDDGSAGFGVVLGNMTEDLVVDGGAGDDQFNLFPNAPGGGQGTVELTLGAGDDNVQLNATAGNSNIAADTEIGLADQAVSIADFTTTEDTLTWALIGGTALATQNLVNGAVDAGQTLLNNLEAVAGVMDDQYAQFVYGSDLILYGDLNGNNDFDAGDQVVTLTGVDELLVQGTNLALV